MMNNLYYILTPSKIKNIIVNKIILFQKFVINFTHPYFIYINVFRFPEARQCRADQCQRLLMAQYRVR